MYVSIRLAIVAVAAGLAAVFVPFGLGARFLLVNTALLVLVAFDVLRAPSATELGVGRDVPPVASLDRRDHAIVRLHNPTERQVEIAVRDASPPSLGRSPRIHRAKVAPGATAVLPAELRPVRRGYAELGPFTLRTSGPLGIAGRQAKVPSSAKIKVYPPLPGRAHVAQRIERARGLQVGTRSSAFRGGGNEFDSLREYHPDDEFRRIDWSATARAGKAISRTYREERDQQILLLFDAGRFMAGSVGGAPRFELAIDAGFTLAELAAYVGDRVGMLAFGRQVERMIGPRAGTEQSKRILDLLFDLEPTLEAADYQRAFATLLSRYRRRALLVLLTELTEERAMAPLIDALPALRATHLVVVASIRDPEVDELVRLAPEDAEAAYVKAAASEQLLFRERAAARLRSLGVAVEDRRPHELAPAVADRYLAIKSAGRL